MECKAVLRAPRGHGTCMFKERSRGHRTELGYKPQFWINRKSATCGDRGTSRRERNKNNDEAKDRGSPKNLETFNRMQIENRLLNLGRQVVALAE